MDIIAIGKANAVLKKIKEIDEVILTKDANGKFATVKERLDFLELQSQSLVAPIIQIVDLTKGVLDGLEVVAGKLKLKQISVGRFLKKGTFETPVIDLGDGFKALTKYTIVSSVTAGKTTALTEVATSTDGITFSAYAVVDKQAARYVKFRITLEATPLATETNIYEFSQAAGNLLTLGSYVEATGDAKLKKVHEYASVDGTIGAEAKYISTLVSVAPFQAITKVEVR